jgi:predicted alpha-1,2-mannosidase
MLSPVLYEDVDGQYRGLDQNIHTSDGFTNYSVFSLWDTYRALHPWVNLIQPTLAGDLVNSMLAHADQSVHGMLPIWSHQANENWCMIGYHAVSVLAEAVSMGVPGIDADRALEAAVETARVPYFDGLGDYIEYGYVPDDRSHSGVSKTLEYAYDDWCIAKLADQLGNTAIANEFDARAKSYRAVWDRESGFMRPRMSDGTFRESFDPLDTHGQGFIEGNAWNYGLYVPHAVDSLIAWHGGPEAFTDHLDSLFTMQLDDRYFAHTEDITRDGIIGNYVHGNEPGHHIPYLYNYAGAPERTQAQVRMICDRMYGPDVDGLCGNDDAGQMSAWYLFSALGFYPVAPASGEYALGSPAVKSAVIHLGNGRDLIIETEGNSTERYEVETVYWNSVPLSRPFIDVNQLANGGTLKFVFKES